MTIVKRTRPRAIGPFAAVKDSPADFNKCLMPELYPP